MLQLSGRQTRDALPFDRLIAALGEMFRSGCEMPPRHHHDMAVPGEADAALLVMPAWLPGAYSLVKIVNVVPGNAERGLPAISAQVLLSSGRTGEMLALIDGGELTSRRTAAASALAARYLARDDASHLVLVGTGRVAENLIPAHRAVRPISRVTVCGRSLEKTRSFAARMAEENDLDVVASDDLEAAVRQADIVSAATLSLEPLIRGAWLQPGAHVDLVGAFKPSMRESDDEAVRRARVFVDTIAGATREGGDIVQPLASGALSLERICGDLFDLARGRVSGRRSTEEITLFKSVGAALEDLAAAILAYEVATD